jgi:type IV secretory pathway TraG/TraD family ATPase VirD4
MNAGFVGRRLIMPDEVMRMHDEEQIIFMKGVPPIRSTKAPYYQFDEHLKKTKVPPPYPVSFD